MWLKAVEVGVLLVAGIAFVIWQFRDLRRAREETQRQAQQKQAYEVRDTDER